MRVSSHSPRILSNALATLVGRGLAQVVRFLAAVAPAASLSPDDWGLFSVLVATVEVVRAITNFGLDAALVRWLTVYADAAGDVLGRVLRIKTLLAMAGVAGLVGYAIVRQESVRAPWMLSALSVGLLPFGWTQSLTSRFQAHHAMRFLIPVQIAVGFLYLSAVVIASVLNVQLSGFILLAVGYEFATWAGTALVARRKLSTETVERASSKTTGELFWEGLPLGGLSIAAVIYARLGVFLVERSGTLADVGHLFLAMKIGEQIALLASPISISALPVFTRFVHQNEAQKIVPIFRRYSLSGAALSVTLAAGISSIAAPLILRLNPEYLNAVPPVVVMAWCAVFMFQNQLSIGVVTAFGKFRQLFGITLLNLAVNMVLAVLLIPEYEAVGASLAMLGTESLHCLIQLVVVARLLR